MKYNEFEHKIGDLVFHMVNRHDTPKLLGVVIEIDHSKYTVQWVNGDVSFHGFEYLHTFKEA